MSKNFYDYMYGGEKTAVAQDADNTYDPQNPTPGKYGLSHEDGSPCDAKTPETCPHNKKAKLVEQKKQDADTLNKGDGGGGGAVAGPTFKSQNREEFIASVKAAKASQNPRKAWRVDVHEKYKDDDGNLQDDLTYNDCKNYATPGGSTVSVKQDGDIISVCKSAEDKKKVNAKALMEHAIANGGNKLDSFSGNFGFYRVCGFEPVSWTPFNKKYAPEGWQEGVDEEEPVIFFAYTGKKAMYESPDEAKAELEKFKAEHPACEGDDGYDRAMKIRDDFIANKKGSN